MDQTVVIIIVVSIFLFFLFEYFISTLSIFSDPKLSIKNEGASFLKTIETMNLLKLTVKSAIFLLLLLFPLSILLVGCGVWEYGPAEDHSEFASAKGIPGQPALLFTANRLIYRRATGINAFPNGGIPKYLMDRHIIGRYDFEQDQLEILVDQPNNSWAHGQGEFSIDEIQPPLTLIHRGGQRRSDLEFADRHYLLQIDRGEFTEISYKKKLKRHGRVVTQADLVDPNGILLFWTVTPREQDQHVSWRRAKEVVPELWTRLPDGQYHFVVATRHYEQYRDGAVIYWNPDDLQFYRVEIRTGTKQILPDYRTPSYSKQEREVSIVNRTNLRVEGEWNYRVPLSLEDL